MKKAITVGKKVVYIDMTPKEEAEYNAVSNSVAWHNPDKPIQVIISEEIKNKLLMIKQEHDILGNHQDVAMLLDYVKNISALSVNEDGNLYIYLSEIYADHKAFLESFGIQINVKANG